MKPRPAAGTAPAGYSGPSQRLRWAMQTDLALDHHEAQPGGSLISLDSLSAKRYSRGVALGSSGVIAGGHTHQTDDYKLQAVHAVRDSRPCNKAVRAD